MRTTLKYLSAACAGALLFACADTSHRADLGTPGPSADASYTAGRQAQLAGHYDEARKAYQAALAADAAHVNARNGLATLYAEQGDYAHAIPIWQALTGKATLDSGPATAYLFGNMGYAYFLSGDFENAQAALEKACLLDPLNYRSWQHLGDTLYKRGEMDRARQMYRQAMALREHDFRADYVTASSAPAASAIDNAVKAEPQPDQQWASSEIRVRQDGMLELYSIPPARPTRNEAVKDNAAPAISPVAAKADVAPAAASAVAPPAAPAAGVALLEIRNGNGVTGMAKALSVQIGDPALKVVRLTNEKGFNVRRTRIEYHGPFRASAQRLAERIGNVSVVEVKNCKPSDMRLVLGRDVARGKFVLRPLETPERSLAVAAEPGKSG
jgi:tetratricopeptide (TPR) repeat protein